MEIKYLSEQDTGDLCYPVVHVKGIVGLDVNPTTTVSMQDIPLANQYLLTGSKVKIAYFDNIVSVSADIQVNGAGVSYLQSGNVIEIANSGFNNTEDVSLDTVTTLNGNLVGGCMGYIWFKDSKLYIKASCKKITYTEDKVNKGQVIETETMLSFDTIVGNAFTTTKSFAPIKPVQPKGYIIFTIPERVSSFVLGPISYVGDIEITTDHGKLDYTKDGDLFAISISGATKAYNIMIKATMSSVVYPNSIPITNIELHDCVGLSWFSVNKIGNNRLMTQNTSLITFSIYGKHRLTTMANMLSGLPLLNSVPNLDTAGVTTMQACFKNSPKLAQLPEMDLTSCYNIAEMCYGCTALNYIPDTIDWSNIVDGSYAFHSCVSLANKFSINSEGIVYTDYMFFGCNNLPEVEMSGRYISTTENMFVQCTMLGVLTIRNIATSVNIQDTNMKTKESIINFMSTTASAPASSPAVLSLPQSIPLYGFDNNFIKQVTDKNWRLL